MPDPFMSTVATAVAGNAAESAVQGGKDACAALVRLVRERWVVTGRGSGRTGWPLPSSTSWLA
jgi:hypothetical protein